MSGGDEARGSRSEFKPEKTRAFLGGYLKKTKAKTYTENAYV